jgi:hypothetical protein
MARAWQMYCPSGKRMYWYSRYIGTWTRPSDPKLKPWKQQNLRYICQPRRHKHGEYGEANAPALTTTAGSRGLHGQQRCGRNVAGYGLHLIESSTWAGGV